MKKSMLNVINFGTCTCESGTYSEFLHFHLYQQIRRQILLLIKWHRLLTWMLQAEFLIIIHLQVQELKM